MIDVLDGESSFASELSKARASAHRVAYLKSILKLYMQLDKINYICYLTEDCPKKGKFT